MTKPKIIFISGNNFVFCDMKCDECPFRFLCFTGKYTAFDVQKVDGEYQVVAVHLEA